MKILQWNLLCMRVCVYVCVLGEVKHLFLSSFVNRILVLYQDILDTSDRKTNPNGNRQKRSLLVLSIKTVRGRTGFKYVFFELKQYLVFLPLLLSSPQGMAFNFELHVGLCWQQTLQLQTSKFKFSGGEDCQNCPSHSGISIVLYWLKLSDLFVLL